MGMGNNQPAWWVLAVHPSYCACLQGLTLRHGVPEQGASQNGVKQEAVGALAGAGARGR